MANRVLPKVYLVGETKLYRAGIEEYLRDTDNEDFLRMVNAAENEGLADGEILTSFMAKLCYNSLSEGKNLNLTRINDIPGNLVNTLAQGHGSVFEHSVYNFVVHNASRVYETEQVRHRVGVAYSILSGRYERRENLFAVIDPILEQEGIMGDGEIDRLLGVIETYMRMANQRIDAKNAGRDLKKKLTSAVRRMLPQGIAREIGFSANYRTLRHLVQIRTNRHAEWEIRGIYNQVYQIVKQRAPLLFSDAKEEMVEGLLEVTGMKMQPYDNVADKA